MALQSPTIDPEEIERFTRIADEWWDEKGKFRPLHQMNPTRLGYMRGQMAEHFARGAGEGKLLDGLTLLDIGCGGGLLCEPMRRLGAEVTGIDAGEKNVQVAKLHAEKMGLTIDYRHESAEALAAQGKQYDVVLALEIVEHVADVPAFLKAISALVKPGGLLFMSTLNRTPKSYALAIVGAEYVLRWLPRGTHEWRKFLKPSELCEGLRGAGMRPHHMTGVTWHPLSGFALNANDLAVNYILTAVKAKP